MTNEIVASLAFIPLNKNQYNKFILNHLEDTELNVDTMEKYQNEGEYYLLFSVITIQKEYRNNPEILYLLLEGFFDKIVQLKKRNITFINMCSEGSTQDGQKFIEKFLDLAIHLKTKVGYNIYKFQNDYQDFNLWFEKFPDYLKNYYRKYLDNEISNN